VPFWVASGKSISIINNINKWVPFWVTPGKSHVTFGGDLTKVISYPLNTTSSYLIIPYHSIIKTVVSSRDVIHSYGLYSFGCKIDAIPGRFNLAFSIKPLIRGLFRGFCFELCGTNHTSMIINVLSLSHGILSWIRSRFCGFLLFKNCCTIVYLYVSVISLGGWFTECAWLFNVVWFLIILVLVFLEMDVMVMGVVRRTLRLFRNLILLGLVMLLRRRMSLTWKVRLSLHVMYLSQG
jgi:hypothetical protein